MLGVIDLVKQSRLRISWGSVAHKKCGEIDDIRIGNNIWAGIKLLDKSGEMLAIGREVKLQRIADRVKGVRRENSPRASAAKNAPLSFAF